MTFHSLCSRSAHGGRLGARLGGGIGEEWGGFQPGGKRQDARDENKWGQVVLSPGSYQNHWGVLKGPMPHLSKVRK